MVNVREEWIFEEAIEGMSNNVTSHRNALDYSDKHTFVVCAYGGSSYLEECVESLVAQTAKSRVIVYTSTPNELIADVAEAFDVPLYVGEGEPGIANDWNRALAVAETPYVTLAHQDDVYLPEYAERMMNLLLKTSSPIISFCDYGEIRSQGIVKGTNLLRVKRVLLSPLRCKSLAGSKAVRRAILSFGTPICCPSVTFNMNVVSRPVFEPSMKCSLDWQAWESLSRLDGAFCYDSKMLMLHRIHSASETSNLIADQTRTREDREMFERFWPAPIAKALNRIYSESQKSNEQ